MNTAIARERVGDHYNHSIKVTFYGKNDKKIVEILMSLSPFRLTQKMIISF